MHGVRLVSTPPMNTAGSACNGLERSGRRMERSRKKGTALRTRKAMTTTQLRTLAARFAVLSVLSAAGVFPRLAVALGALFHFDASKPTSILYSRGADGTLHLVGAMYTMPKNAKLDRLNDRVPLSIARWHKHVNWCLPKGGDEDRWLEQKNGKPVFG